VITSSRAYRKIISGFINEEDVGIQDYRKLVDALPSGEHFDDVRSAIQDIVADERRHITMLKRLLAKAR